MYEIGQGIIQVSDVVTALRRSDSPVGLEHFDLPIPTFMARFQGTPAEIITELSIPIWFIIGKSNRKTADWRAVHANGETVHLSNAEIFCTAELRHGTNRFQRWAVINKLNPESFAIKQLAGDCPITQTKFELLNRVQFAVLLQPKQATVGPRGLIKSQKELGPLLFNTPHFNQYHGKFIKSKYGLGYLAKLPKGETPEYTFTHRNNAVNHDFFGSYPTSPMNDDDQLIYYIPLEYFEPYAVPTGTLAPKTHGVINWCITGCDDLIKRSL